MDSFYILKNYQPARVASGIDFGFSIKLDIELARKAMQTKINEKACSNLQRIAKQIIVDAGFQDYMYMIKPAFNFLEGDDKELTNLLHWCDVPGDACSLCLEGNEIYYLKNQNTFREYIEYSSHNVDNSQQAYALLSVWSFWADTIKAVLSDK